MLAVFNRIANESQRSGQVYHVVLSREAYCSCKVSRVCVASVIWVLKIDGMIVLPMIDRLSDANMSFKHYSPFLCCLVATVADSSKKVADYE